MFFSVAFLSRRKPGGCLFTAVVLSLKKRLMGLVCCWSFLKEKERKKKHNNKTGHWCCFVALNIRGFRFVWSMYKQTKQKAKTNKQRNKAKNKNKQTTTTNRGIRKEKRKGNNKQSNKDEVVPLVGFMYFVLIHTPGESYRRWVGSVCSCDVFRVLISSLCVLIHTTSAVAGLRSASGYSKSKRHAREERQ